MQGLYLLIFSIFSFSCGNASNQTNGLNQSIKQSTSAKTGTIWTPVALNAEKESVNGFVIGKNSRIIAATSAGIMISDDKGLVWKAAKINPDDKSAAFSIVKDDVGNIYAGLSKYGILVSSDNGESWKLFNQGLNMGGPRSSYTMITSGTRVFKGTFESGLYLSTDAGKSWNPNNKGIPLNLSSNRMVSVTQLVKNSNTIYALTDLGVRYSKDNGDNWNKPAHNGIERLGYMSSIAVNGSNLFTGITTSQKGVFVSTDNGENWKAAGLDGKEPYVLSVIGNSLYAGANGNIYRSNDNGKTWTAIGEGLPPNSTIYSMGVTPDGKLLAGLNKGGIYLLK